MSTKSKEKKEASGEVVATAARTMKARAMKTAAKRDKDGGKPTTQAGSKAAKGTVSKAAKAKANSKSPSRSKLSALDAAAQVLESRGEAMRAGDLIEAMAKQDLWTSPGGKTPDATLSAAMNREIVVKGRESRFKKSDRGLFEFVSKRR